MSTVVLPDPPPSQTTVPLPVAASPDPLTAFVGHYRITGTPRSDGCAGAIVLAATAIDVASTRPVLHPNVVDRDYDARADGDQLVAEGSFPARVGCDGDLFERWTLRRSASGLEGELVSEWPFPPSCASRCRVVFAISARRTDPGSSP
jgi:hypothetical protein